MVARLGDKPYLRAMSGMLGVLHPLLLPVYCTAGLLWAAPEAAFRWPPLAKLYFLAIVLLNYGLLPLLLIYAAHTGGWLNLTTHSPQNRRVIFILTVGVYVLSSAILWWKAPTDGMPFITLWIAAILAGGLWATSEIYKISVHTAAMGSLTGYFAALWAIFSHPELFYLMLCGLVLTGAIGSARLYVQAHTPAEVYIGAVTGFLLSSIATWLATTSLA